MKRTTRLLAGTLMTLALTAGIPMATATTANAAQLDILLNGVSPWVPVAPLPGAPTVYPGMYLDFTGDYTNFVDGEHDPVKMEAARANGKFTSAKSCTMGPVGTDSAGRKVGITAGHCRQPDWLTQWGAPLHPGPPRGVEVSVQDRAKYPVYDKNTVKWSQKVAADTGQPVVPPNPIGWIRWVDNDTCEMGETGGDDEPCAINPTQTDMGSLTDYMVIEFAPEVQLSSQVRNKTLNPVMSLAGGGRPFKVNSINTNSNGTPALPAVLFNDVELYGARTDREPTALVPLSPSSGIVTNVNNGIIRAAAGFEGGDSGGPVVLLGTGKWVGIVTATLGGIIPPWVNTSAKNILGDLNPRGIVGSGFTPVNN